jgi:hypothetical protein
MKPNITLPIDDEETRLFGLYERSSAKEIAATCQLLYPGRNLPYNTYMNILADLRVIRTECNKNMLAVGKHRREMQAKKGS